MSITRTRRLGRTALDIPVFGVGTCPLGDLFEAIPEDDARATLEAAWDAGVRLYDTAPWYGLGQGEHRAGRALYRRPRHGYVLSTKVGRRLFAPRDRAAFKGGPWKGGLAFDHLHDYSYDGVLRSYEDSLQRLGINKVDILYIHDLDSGYFPQEADLLARLKELETGGFRALEELKAAGAVAAIGAGINERGMIGRFLDRYPLDVFLVASRYTLLEQNIFDELQRARREGAGIVVGGVFNSGILATGPSADARYEYAAAPAGVLDQVRRLDTVARRHRIALAAAALQFPFGFDAVASVLSGPSRAGEIVENAAFFQQSIPADFWRELKAEGLLAEDIPTPAEATAAGA